MLVGDRRLCDEGVKLMNYYVQEMCTPTRAGEHTHVRVLVEPQFGAHARHAMHNHSVQFPSSLPSSPISFSSAVLPPTPLRAAAVPLIPPDQVHTSTAMACGMTQR